MNALVSVFVFLIKLNLISGEVLYEGHQVWRVIPESPHALDMLQLLGNIYQLDFWQDPTQTGVPVDFRVPPQHLKELRDKLVSNNLKDIKVFISNIQTLIENEKSSRKRKLGARTAAAKSVGTFDYSVYHTAEEMNEWMNMVVTEYGDIATKEQIGVTFQGRPIHIIKLEKRTNTTVKPVIFVDSLIHPREWVTGGALMFIVKEMLQNSEYSHMLDEVDWYFLPLINVDGYIETWTGDRLWRRTKSTGSSSLCPGVDGNRNWDAHWGFPGAGPNPCTLSYYGPTAFSESEVRHLARYIEGFQEKVAKIDAYVTTHSYSQFIMYPYFYSLDPSADEQVLNHTAKLMHEAIYDVHGKYYVYGQGSTTIYVSSGSTVDWTYDYAKIKLSFAYELRDTGEYAFLLPDDRIIPNGEEYLAGIEALSNYVVEHFGES